jgi:hypothetical protein
MTSPASRWQWPLIRVTSWRDSHTVSPVAYQALLICTVVVAAVTFALSFHGLSDYGQHVAGVNGWMSWLVPVGVDGLTLCAVAATFLLRHASLHIRVYAWFVFAVAVGSSVAGNLSHAAARGLSWEGKIGAAAWPILLALASHLVIVTRRALERASHDTSVAPHDTRDIPSKPYPQDPGPRTPTAAIEPTTALPVIIPTAVGVTPAAVTMSEPVTSPDVPATRGVIPMHRVGDMERRHKAHVMRQAGHTNQEIADAVGATVRTVQRWLADVARDDHTPARRDSGDDTEERSA